MKALSEDHLYPQMSLQLSIVIKQSREERVMAASERVRFLYVRHWEVQWREVS